MVVYVMFPGSTTGHCSETFRCQHSHVFCFQAAGVIQRHWVEAEMEAMADEDSPTSNQVQHC